VSKDVERDQVLGHEDEADGIQEYDNPLPDWWLGLFWATIIFGFAYGIHYHFIAHRSPQKALAQELAEARERWPAPAEAAGAPFLVTEELAEDGAAVYAANCVACHGTDLKGGIGPNLLDDEWIHGGRPEDILHTITLGVTTKGMLAWEPIIGPERVREVAAYVVAQNAKALGRPLPGKDEESVEHKEDGERS
jgi:cytochrome c oxidase cbb3-type subunit 3